MHDNGIIIRTLLLIFVAILIQIEKWIFRPFLHFVPLNRQFTINIRPLLYYHDLVPPDINPQIVLSVALY